MKTGTWVGFVIGSIGTGVQTGTGLDSWVQLEEGLYFLLLCSGGSAVRWVLFSRVGWIRGRLNWNRGLFVHRGFKRQRGWIRGRWGYSAGSDIFQSAVLLIRPTKQIYKLPC
jgi:hypothetical protein